MIIGLGSDIININRIIKLLNGFGVKAEERILTQHERLDLSRINPKNALGRAAFFAKRFAAKEACVKALGTGFREGIRFTDIEITHDKYGKPSIVLYQRALEVMEQQVARGYKAQFNVSLSDDFPLAQAIVIFSSEKENA